MRRIIVFLPIFSLALGLAIVLPAGEPESTPPPAPAPKAAMPFLDMLPADSAMAALNFKDIKKFIADMRTLLSRVPSLEIRDELGREFLSIMLASYEWRELFPIISLEEFENSGLAAGSYANIPMLPPPTKTKGVNEKGEEVEIEVSAAFPLDIHFYRPEKLEPLKAILDKCLKQTTESNRYGGWTAPGEKKKEEDKGGITTVMHEGVEIQIAKDKSGQSFIILMYLNGTAVYVDGWSNERIATCEALFKNIIDASKGKARSLADDEEFQAGMAKLDPADNFVVWARVDPMISFFVTASSGRGPGGPSAQEDTSFEKLRELSTFGGMGFHGEGDMFKGSLAMKLPNDKIKGLFGADAWSMARCVPEEGLSILGAVDLDLNQTGKLIIEYFSSFGPEIKKGLDEILANVEAITEKDTEKELLPLFGRKVFFAMYGMSSRDMPQFLAGIELKGEEVIELGKQALEKMMKGEYTLQLEAYKGFEYHILGIEGAEFYIMHHEDMLLFTMNKPIIQRAINCLRGKGAAFSDDEELAKDFQGSCIVGYFDGPTLLSAFKAGMGPRRASRMSEELILDVFRRARGVAKVDDFGLTGKAWMKLGPEIKFSKEQKNAIRARTSEAAVIASLRTLSSTQEQYYSRFGKYGTLTQLSTEQYIDPVLGSGIKSGYIFRVRVGQDAWSCIAVPATPGVTGMRGFFVDQTGVLRYTPNGTPPTPVSPALDY
ncbi:MAG: hypothetical protein ACYS8W_04080 [Planctomycetota bacterium]|jgi:hypothetical protein